jgi:hypothetical protein
MDNNTTQKLDTQPNFEFQYDGATNTLNVYGHVVMHGLPCRGWIGWEPMTPGASYPPLFRLYPRRDLRSITQLRSALGAFDPSPTIVIDLKDFKGLPIESAPKDGTRILVRATSQGGWIEAYWDDDILDKHGDAGGDWTADHHCEWHSRLDPDLWLPLPGGGK